MIQNALSNDFMEFSLVGLQLAIKRAEYLSTNTDQASLDDEMLILQAEHIALQNGFVTEARYLSEVHESFGLFQRHMNRPR